MQADEAINAIFKGVRAYAYRHAISAEQAKDFLQEGLMYALFALPKYADKDPQDLERILAKVAFNRITTLQSGSVRASQRHFPLESLDSIMQQEFNDFVESDNLVRVLLSRLSSVAQRVLKERLNPGVEVQNVLLEEQRAKRRARRMGKLVMDPNSEEIRDVHIAKGLGLSKASVSRAATQIRIQGETLLRSQEGPIEPVDQE